jgi:ribonuclease VapC
MASIVFDSSAILAALWSEPGAEMIRANVGDGIVSAVNAAEVGTKLAERGVGDAYVRGAIGTLGVQVVPFHEDDAHRAALLRLSTRQYGLSLGDRACLALAASRNLPILTTDRNWARLNIGIDIRLARGTE